MAIETVAPIIGASGFLSALAMKAPELLKEVYGDLAKPGVQQVGSALRSVLQLGNNILLPLRLANETARAFEERKFAEIADRFTKIPEDEIVEVAPEIGVPVLERLSYTDDVTLRRMFIELLAKASTKSQVGSAHPSFVGVIGSLAPDEAILISSFKDVTSIPMVSVDAVSQADSSAATLYDFIVVPPPNIVYANKVPFYLSNLIGLGLVEIFRDTWLTAPEVYSEVEQHARLAYPFPPSITIGSESRIVQLKRHVMKILPYGAAFIESCT